MNKYTNKQNGFSLVLVLSIMLLTTIVVTSVYVTMSTEVKSRKEKHESEIVDANVRSGIAITETWFARNPGDSVAAVIQALISAKNGGNSNATLDISHIGKDPSKYSIHISNIVEASNSYQLMAHIGGKKGVSKKMKIVAFDIRGLEKKIAPSLVCDSSSSPTFALYNGETFDCSSANILIYGNAFFGGDICINGSGSIEVFSYKGMAGNFVGIGQEVASNASNINGPIAAEGDILITDPNGLNFGSTGRLNNINGSPKTSGYDYYGATVGSPKNPLANQEVLSDLRDIADAPSPGFVIEDSVIVSKSIEYEKTCTDYSGSQCDKIDVNELNNIYARLPESKKYFGFAIIDISDISDQTWNNPSGVSLHGNFALIDTTSTTHNIAMNYEFPSSTPDSRVLLYIKKGIVNFGIHGNGGLCNCLIVQKDGTFKFYPNGKGAEADTIKGSVYLSEGTHSEFNTAGDSLVLMHDPDVLEDFKQLGLLYSTEPAIDSSTGICKNPKMVPQGDTTLIALTEKLTITPLGILVAKKEVDTSNVINVEDLAPLLILKPAKVTEYTDEVSSYSDIVSKYSLQQVVYGGTSCSDVDSIQTEVTTVNDAITNNTAGIFWVTYHVSCSNGNDSAKLWVELKTKTVSSSSEVSSSSSEPEIPPVSSSSYERVYSVPGFNDGIVPGKIYEFRNASSGMCLELMFGGWGGHREVRDFPCNGTTSQQWEFDEVATGVFTFQNQAVTSDYLQNNPSDQGWGRNVRIYPGTAAWERWRFEANADGSFDVISQRDGKCLKSNSGTVSGVPPTCSPSNGHWAYTSNCNTGARSKWELVRVNQNSYINSGLYEIVNNQNNAYLDVDSWGTNYNRDMHVQCRNYGANQQFWVTNIGNGEYTIKGRHSNRYIHEYYNDVTLGHTTVDNYHKWYINKGTGGTWHINPKTQSNRCLRIASTNETDPGDDAIIGDCWDPGTNDYYEWYFQPREQGGNGYNIYLDNIQGENDFKNEGGDIGTWGGCYIMAQTSQYEESVSLRSACESKGGVVASWSAQRDKRAWEYAQLKFVIKSTTLNLNAKIEWGNTAADTAKLPLTDFGLTQVNKWQEITIPFTAWSHKNMKKLRVPFHVYNVNFLPNTFKVDNVYIYIPAASCNDGFQNGSETGIDCGGGCSACAATCNDGIQNQDESGTDCGGSSCGACITRFEVHQEAEGYSGMSGIQTGSSVEGGLTVGWIDPNDWVQYNSISLEAGNYKARYRVSTWDTDVKIIDLELNGNLQSTASINYSTWPGGANQFETYTNIESGTFHVPFTQTYTVRLTFKSKSFNVNWIKFIPVN